MLAGPPSSGDYFAAWRSRGYTEPGGYLSGFLRSELPSSAQINPFLDRYTGKAGVVPLRQMVNELRRAKDPNAREIVSEDIYQVKKQLRPLLQDLF